MLPYGSMEEAEAALGRRLTSTEALWFRYSGTMSNFSLYCHNTIFAVIVFTIAPLPLVLMELSHSAGIYRYKIQPRVRLSSSEMLSSYRDVVWKFAVVVGPLQLVSYPSIKMVGIRTGLPLPSGWEIFLQLVVLFRVGSELLNMVFHRHSILH